MKLRKMLAASAAGAIALTAAVLPVSADNESVDIALYVGNNVDWATVASDAVTVSADGEYTLEVKDLAIAKDALTVIYIKDAAVESKEATKTELPEGVTIETKAVEVNGEALALAEGYPTAVNDQGVLDIAYYNIWGDNFVDVSGVKEINTVKVTFSVSGLAAEAAPAAATSLTIPATEEYGDWGGMGIISFDALKELVDVTDTAAVADGLYVTLNFETTVDDAHTYWLIKPAEMNGWNAITIDGIAQYEDDTDHGYAGYYQQTDGFINLLDNTLTSMTVKLTADNIAALVANPATNDDGTTSTGFLFQVYGVTIKDVTVSTVDPATVVEEADVAAEEADEVAEDADAEEAVETEAAADEAVEDDADEAADEAVAAEPDMSAYDADAAKAANDAFVFGVNDMIDLTAVLGDNYADLAKIDATFTWTAGTGFCGGAGLGNGATLADGSTWFSGPEFGCANANLDFVDDGKITQTIMDITGNPITSMAAVAEDGTTTFGALYVQNWWNGVEAGAKLEKLSFLDADGNEIAVLNYGAEEVADDTAAADAVDTAAAPATDDKASADTGVEGVAVVAGLAVLAAGAVIVAKKRK